MGCVGLLALLATVVIGAAAPRKSDLVEVKFFPAQQIWQATLGAPPAGAAVQDGQRLFVALRTGSIAALALTTGAPVWSVRLDVRGPIATDGQRLIAPTEDAIEALDPATGSALWRTPLADGVVSAVTATGGWVFVTGETTIWALNATTGERVWQQVVGATARAAPFAEGDRVYTGTRDGHLIALQVKDGSRVWTSLLEGETAGIVADPDRVYLGTRGKMFYSLRAKDGSVDWRWRVGAEVAAAPLLARKHVFMVAFDNVLRAFDRGNGAAQWKMALHARPVGPPVMIGPSVLPPYLAPEIRGFAETDGRDQGHFTIDRELSGPMVVWPRPYPQGGALVIAVLSDGMAVALRSRVEAPVVPLDALPGVPVPLDLTNTPTAAQSPPGPPGLP